MSMMLMPILIIGAVVIASCVAWKERVEAEVEVQKFECEGCRRGYGYCEWHRGKVRV